MKILITMLLVSLPAAAQAGGMYGGGHKAMMGMHFATLLYAVIAALGYWVLQHSAKETAAFVKRTGIGLGMFLVVVGMLGVLCGVGSHVKKQAPCCPVSVEQGSAAELPAMMEKAAEPAKKKGK
ncbi:MAG TPA: hypothetical protein DCZ92_07035 [Elusimicrobia bacterium]|nr:MAG: hypothetical protein A2016_04930 [Elusimicrobia bacterium GWF2_62_30]HBA60560.1 hypothetical protein [Elusimicrobiota bacterium]